ncbi:MAG TPA: nuclear transport factor 2 family protein [Mycobacteriales bacterium]|nr:nuclear transport factor 2 family protein [Mycobacteriales bacterium]
MELWELVAREEIRSCVARYNAAGDAGRMDDMMGAFAEDAIMEIDGEQTKGRDAIAAIFRDAGRGFVRYAKTAGTPRDVPVLKHFTSTLDITVSSPTEAHASMYYAVLMYHGLDHWGRYVDDYKPVGDRWYIAHRREFMEGASVGGFGARHMAEMGRGGF